MLVMGLYIMYYFFTTFLWLTPLIFPKTLDAKTNVKNILVILVILCSYHEILKRFYYSF